MRTRAVPAILLFVIAISALAAGKSISLLRDPGFSLGVNVLSPAAGRRNVEGILRPPNSPTTSTQPAWDLTQWNSRFSLGSATGQRGGAGEVIYSDPAKTIAFDPDGLTLSINGAREGAPWPRLMLEQPIPDAPPLTDLSRINFHIECKLLRGVPPQNPAGTQFLIYLAIQHVRPQSSAEGDYTWFEIPVYDDRERIPRGRIGRDRATGIFIYDPGGAAFTTDSAQDGQWLTIDRNVLPQIWIGVRRAMAAGQLGYSGETNDLRLTRIVIGWELHDPLDGSMKIRKLSLETVKK